MKTKLLLVFGAAGLGLGSLIGFWLGTSSGDGVRPEHPASREEAATPAAGTPVRDPADADILRLLREQLADEKSRSAATAAELARVQGEVARLEAAAQKTESAEREKANDTARRIDGLVKRIHKLKESEYESFLSPAIMAEVIADIKALGDEGVNALVSMLSSEDAADRRLAGQIMVSLNDPRTVGPLHETALGDDDALAAAWASQALMRMESPEVVSALKDLHANSKHDGVKVNSLWGLCKNGDDDGINSTLAYLKNKENNGDLRRALGVGMFLLRGEKILGVVDHYTPEVANEPQVMKMAFDYYTSLKNETGRQRIAAWADNPEASDAVRKLAREALNK